MNLHAIWALLFLSTSYAFAVQNDLDEISDEESRLLSIFPATDDQHRSLQQLLTERRSGCELLKYPLIQGVPVDVLCHGIEARDLISLLEGLELPFISSRSDFDSGVDNTLSRSNEETETALNDNIRFTEYNRYDQIQAYISQVATDHQSFVMLESASVKKTYEERSLKYLRIGTTPYGDNTRMVWIDAGIHAREWISVSTVLYTIDRLVRIFKKKFEDQEPLSEKEEDLVGVDWLIMPLLNPDGYEYSHFNKSEKVRLWRKNRSPQEKGCFGVDLNRNFDVDGYGTGSKNAVSNNPCHGAYVGKEKATEEEVKMASEVVMANKDKIKVALSLHCYGSYILTPWAYLNTTPSDSDRMVDFGKRLYKSIKTVNPQRNYTVGPSGKLFFYTAGGSSLDYFKATAGIPYVATIELPGNYTNGTRFPEYYGFQSPLDQLLLVGREIWAAMFEVAKTAREEPLGSDSTFK